MVIYFVVFISLAIGLSSTQQSNSSTPTMEKIQIAFINNDSNSVLLTGFKEYLKENEILVQVKNDQQSIQDALFFRNAEYIIKAPTGFTQSFMNGRSVNLEKIAVQDSASQVYMDLLINNYFNTARLYIKNIKNISQTDLVEHIKQDLSKSTKVELHTFNSTNNANGSIQFYFSYLAYSMIAILLIGVGSFMMVFNDTDIKRRNLCSPLKSKSMNMQILLGNFAFSITLCALLIIISIIMFFKQALSMNGLFLDIDLLVFSISILSLSYFIGTLIKSKRALQGIVNTLSLGLCFISGVFVPQQYLGKTVQLIANFTPTYWYVKATNVISGITSFNLSNSLPFIYDMLIQLGFAIAVFAVALAIVKQKRVSNS